jgi:hypothetical protein
MDKINLSTTEEKQINLFKMMVYTCEASLQQIQPAASVPPGQKLNIDEPRTMMIKQITFTPVAKEY